MGKIWAVCSGSGGVGKSTVALALAAGAAKAGGAEEGVANYD